MARFCTKCGASISKTAKFCNVCGYRLPERPATGTLGTPASQQGASASQESIPVWKGWETQNPPQAVASQPVAQPSVAPAPSQNQAYAPGPSTGASYAAPPVASSSETAPAAEATPPQYWSSYDYSDPTAPASSPSGTGADSPYQYTPSRDASRPLPPLSDFFNEEDSAEDTREKAKETIINFSLWAAGIVLCPIPFSDLILLMPIQSAMVIAVGKVYGVKEPPEKLLAVIAGACGVSVFGQLTMLCLSGFLPFIGKLISAPFIFGWTYGLGEVAMRYFESHGQASSDELKGIFKKASKDASKNFDSSKSVAPNAALNNLRDYMSEEEYRKIKERFGPEAQ